MHVKAKERGYYGGRLIEPGDTFEIAHEDDLGRWMEPVKAEKAAKEPAPPKEPAKAEKAAK